MDLIKRIERLEKQNRILRFFCGMTAVAVICLAAMGATSLNQVSFQKVIKAQKFELIDGTGKTRGEMSVNNLGPYVHLEDRANGILASMGIANGVPHLTLKRAGQTRSFTR